MPPEYVAGEPVRDLAEADRVQRLGDPRGALAAGYVEDAGEELDVLPAGEARIGRQLLRYVAEQAPYGHLVPGRVVAEDLDDAGRYGQECGDRAHGGGLARAVGPEKAEHLPRPTSRSRPSTAFASPKL